MILTDEEMRVLRGILDRNGAVRSLEGGATPVWVTVSKSAVEKVVPEKGVVTEAEVSITAQNDCSLDIYIAGCPISGTPTRVLLAGDTLNLKGLYLVLHNGGRGG